jgi:oxygen-independent coproporphyrinogen-3 oxidase
MREPVAVYFHIPFCHKKCGYCDFSSFAMNGPIVDRSVDAIVRQVHGSPFAGRPAKTVFFGGGTPNFLSSAQLARILSAVLCCHPPQGDIEITAEANPGASNAFAELREAGFNRLSLGVQSFLDADLQRLGRIHTAKQAREAVSLARRAGFDNLSLDLMMWLPAQTLDEWMASVDAAIAEQPEHLSLYMLELYPNAPLGDEMARRGWSLAPDADAAAMYAEAMASLEVAGYEQYEISNWAKHIGASANQQISEETDALYAAHLASAPSFACRHNLVYWRREPYLGFGAGAHSFAAEQRWWNVRPVPDYIRRIAQGRSPEAGRENLDRRTALGEAMMLGLRLTHEGMPYARFRALFGVELEEAFGGALDRLVGRGLLERLPDRVRLTPRGRLLGNQVFAAFFG